MCATQPLLVAISKRVYKKSESKWCWDFGVREAQNYIRNGVYLECADGTGATGRLASCKGSPMLSPSMGYYVGVEDWRFMMMEFFFLWKWVKWLHNMDGGGVGLTYSSTVCDGCP